LLSKSAEQSNIGGGSRSAPIEGGCGIGKGLKGQARRRKKKNKNKAAHRKIGPRSWGRESGSFAHSVQRILLD